MARRIALALILVFGSLQAQAFSMKWSQDERPMPPLKFTVTRGQLIKVEYSDPTSSLQKSAVLLHVEVARKDGSEKTTFSLLVPPVGAEEIGMLQGWTPQPGDSVHVEAKDFRSVDFGNL